MSTHTLTKTNSKPRRKVKQYEDKNPIEQIVSIGGGVAQQGKDFGKKAFDFEELLGLKSEKDEKNGFHGDLSEGQELSLKDLKKQEEKQEKAYIEPGIDYSREMVHLGERATTSENRELETQLREIMVEIKKLADSSKELQVQFKEVAIEQHVVKPGKYHKSFFTWMLSMIQIARRKVEDSGAWLAALHSKKKSREYGAMAKKHGTSFSLSNERVVATQVG